MKQPKLRLVTAALAPAQASTPKIAPPVTTTGGEIQDIVTLPAVSRDRIGRIVTAGRKLEPLAGMYTTRSARILAAQHLDTIITHATALRAELPA